MKRLGRRIGKKTELEKRLEWLELYILRNGETWSDDFNLIAAYTTMWKQQWQIEKDGEVRCDRMRRDLKTAHNRGITPMKRMRASKYGRIEFSFHRPPTAVGDSLEYVRTGYENSKPYYAEKQR